jgi:glycosyltransferase involved in cell wall biosynthesis
LIHAHGYEAAIAAWICRKLTGLPVIYSGHNTMEDELATYNFIRPKWVATALAKLLDFLVPRGADRCLPHSANIEAFFHRMGLRRQTEPVVNFGIDLDGLDQGDGAAIRRVYDLGDGPVIGYTGVLDRFQRLDLLLEATAQVVQDEPGTKLLLIVTIPQEEHLARVRSEADKLGITANLMVTDPQPISSVRDYLSACDVTVVPRPQAPGFPIKLLNYLAARKPCVLFASSASTGIEHGKNAFLVESNTSAALGRAILQVVRDPALGQQLADNGHRFVRDNHDRRLIAQQVCASYYRTLASGANESRIHDRLGRRDLRSDSPLGGGRQTA